MSSSHTSKHGKATRLLALCAAICALAALPLLAGARVRSASISIANNSGRSIVHVYLSHTNQEDWGPNQLGESPIAPGETYVLSNVSWDQPQVKVIAEDSNGCFLSAVFSSSGNSTWTINADAPADCGL